jgi:hypothetical protein
VVLRTPPGLSCLSITLHGSRVSQGLQLLLLEKASVLFHAQAHISQDLAQEGPNDDLRTVVGDDHDASFSIAAALPVSPAEPRSLSHLAQFPVGYQAEARQAATSTRQVPTKSGSGSSGSTVLR